MRNNLAELLDPTVRNFITPAESLAEVCAANERAIEAMPRKSWLYGIGIDQCIIKTADGEILRFSAKTVESLREFQAAKLKHGIS